MTIRVDSVVFDLDATLINLGEHVEWRRAQGEVAKTYLAGGCSRLDVEACGANGLFRMLDEMWSINKGRLGEDKAEEIQREAYEALDRHEEKGVEKCSLMPGCIDALGWIRERGVPIGVCTSNSQKTAERALRLRGLDVYVKALVGRSTAYRMKPAPDQLKACYDSLGADPTRSVMVGDSHNDVKAGKAMGSYTVAVPVYFTRLDKLEEAGVDTVIGSLAELPGVLERL